MDIGLVAALTPAPAAAPAQQAGAAVAPGVQVGFGAALAQALGALAATVAKTGAPKATNAAGTPNGAATLAATIPADGSVPAAAAASTGSSPERTSSPAAAQAHERVAVHTMAELTEHGAPSLPAQVRAEAGLPLRAGPAADSSGPGTETRAPESLEHEMPAVDTAGTDGAAARAPATPGAPALAASTARVERSLDRLAPEFRTRLERVIERMQDELGLKVRVVETFRTQERQDALFEQGRTESGPKVTWTRRSNHTLGRAADLRVDGTDAKTGYAQLARIAQEEGLRTLGPNDPGHVELPRSATHARAGAPAPQRTYTTHAVPRVAQPLMVAQVAQPARVAQVAHVAHVVAPGSTSRAPAATSARTPAAEPVLPETAAPRAAAAIMDSPAREIVVPTPESPIVAREGRPAPAERPVLTDTAGTRTDSPSSERAAAAHRPAAARAGTEPARTKGEPAADTPVRTDTFVASGNAERAAAPAPATPAAPAQGTDIASRVARLLALQDATAQAPTTGMTLMLDGVDGAAARIRLGVRGNAVGATIDVADAVEAKRLGDRIGELTRALERQGLEPATVTVRDVPGLRDVADVTRVVATTVVAGTADTGAGSRSGDSEHDRPSGQNRRDPGTADDRQSRRNPKEGQK